MKFEVGQFYRTRDGDKAEILRTDLEGMYPILILLYKVMKESDKETIENDVKRITANGRAYRHLEDSEWDLVSEWDERDDIEFDPSVLPEWATHVAQDYSGTWHWFSTVPDIGIDGKWHGKEGSPFGVIPRNYEPRGFTGGWERSCVAVERGTEEEG